MSLSRKPGSSALQSASRGSAAGAGRCIFRDLRKQQVQTGRTWYHSFVTAGRAILIGQRATSYVTRVWLFNNEASAIFAFRAGFPGHGLGLALSSLPTSPGETPTRADPRGPSQPAALPPAFTSGLSGAQGSPLQGDKTRHHQRVWESSATGGFRLVSRGGGMAAEVTWGSKHSQKQRYQTRIWAAKGGFLQATEVIRNGERN